MDIAFDAFKNSLLSLMFLFLKINFRFCLECIKIVNTDRTTFPSS